MNLGNDNDNNASITHEEESVEQKINLEMEEEIDCNDSTSMKRPDDAEACVEVTCCEEKHGRFRCYPAISFKKQQ